MEDGLAPLGGDALEISQEGVLLALEVYLSESFSPCDPRALTWENVYLPLTWMLLVYGVLDYDLVGYGFGASASFLLLLWNVALYGYDLAHDEMKQLPLLLLWQLPGPVLSQAMAVTPSSQQLALPEQAVGPWEAKLVSLWQQGRGGSWQEPIPLWESQWWQHWRPPLQQVEVEAAPEYCSELYGQELLVSEARP